MAGRISRFISSTWGRTGASLRRTAVAMWVLGLAVFLTGLWVDELGWWADRPFLSNMSSALASVLFGTPFALLVIQSLTEAEADRLAKKSTIELTLRATEHLESVASGLTVKLISRDLRGRAEPTLRKARQALTLDAWDRVEATDGLSTSLGDLHDWLQTSRAKLSEAAAQLAASWSVWKQVVANRLYLFEIDVINFGVIGSLDSAVDRLRAALSEDLRVPSADSIAGQNRHGSSLPDVVNLLVADNVARRLAEAAEVKEMDARLDHDLANLVELLVVVGQIDREIGALWSSISTLESRAEAEGSRRRAVGR
jgi:hypothetical protein